jgi:hypothetical protein
MKHGSKLLAGTLRLAGRLQCASGPLRSVVGVGSRSRLCEKTLLVFRLGRS